MRAARFISNCLASPICALVASLLIIANTKLAIAAGGINPNVKLPEIAFANPAVIFIGHVGFIPLPILKYLLVSSIPVPISYTNCATITPQPIGCETLLQNDVILPDIFARIPGLAVALAISFKNAFDTLAAACLPPILATNLGLVNNFDTKPENLANTEPILDTPFANVPI